MRLSLVLLSVLQSVILCTGQTLLKVAMSKMSDFSITVAYSKELLTNLWLLASGICFILSGILWMHIMKHFPLSLAYPLISFSYVLGMFSAIIFFGEQVVWSQWLGVFFIITGCALIAT